MAINGNIKIVNINQLQLLPLIKKNKCILRAITIIPSIMNIKSNKKWTLNYMSNHLKYYWLISGNYVLILKTIIKN